jgi:hypothetical protein
MEKILIRDPQHRDFLYLFGLRRLVASGGRRILPVSAFTLTYIRIKIKSRKERRGLPLKETTKKLTQTYLIGTTHIFFSHVPIKRKTYLADNKSQFFKDIFVFVF